MQPGRQQFAIIGLPAEGMFHADAYYCVLLIAVLFLLIVRSSLLRVVLEHVPPPVPKSWVMEEKTPEFLSFKW